MVNHPPLDASVDIRHYAAQEVQLLRLQCVGEELHQDGDINHRPEYLVKPCNSLLSSIYFTMMLGDNEKR